MHHEHYSSTINVVFGGRSRDNLSWITANCTFQLVFGKKKERKKNGGREREKKQKQLYDEITSGQSGYLAERTVSTPVCLNSTVNRLVSKPRERSCLQEQSQQRERGWHSVSGSGQQTRGLMARSHAPIVRHTTAGPSRHQVRSLKAAN